MEKTFCADKIFSADIDKSCAVCEYSSPAAGVETHLSCAARHEYVPIYTEGCPMFRFDIFKRPVRRRKKLDTSGFSKEDFAL